MPDSGETALEGRMAGTYRVLEPLGSGGMGVVYKGFDTQLRRTVALKFVSAQAASGGLGQRCLEEARAASALDHPNIGTIYGVERDAAGQFFIVMAYYDGETLAQRIARGALPFAEALEVGEQVAAGLAAAHRADILHRDIKPSNLIFSASGIVKIVDFGLARMMNAENQTETLGVAGTAAYLSPEQALGKPADRRSDVWSLGIVLWEMVNGMRPFVSESVPALLWSVVNEAPPALPDTVPEPVRALLYRALAKKPEERYADGGDFERAIGRAKAGVLPTEAVSKLRHLAGPPPRKARFAVRAALGAAAALALIAGAVIARNPFEKRVTQHVAILPIENPGGAPDEALTDGIQENLTDRLSNLEGGASGLWVVPASEVRRRKIAEPAQAHRNLGATAVVTGSIRRDGNGLHLALHLIDAKDLRQLGAETLDGKPGDLAGLQNRAVESLARMLKVPVQNQARLGNPGHPAAYESYLKALGYLHRYDKPGNVDRAIKELQTAVQTDPKFALAFAAMGEAYVLKFHADQNSRWLKEGDEACRKAAALDTTLPMVSLTLGRLHAEAGQRELAEQEFLRTLALDPSNAQALFGLADVQEKQGLPEKAKATFQRAAAIRPDDWDGYNRLGRFYIRQKQYAEAEREFRRVVELTPDNSYGHTNLGAALHLQKKDEAAAREFEESIRLAPSYAVYSNLSSIYYHQLKFAEAAAQAEKALALNKNDFRVWKNYVMANRWLERQGHAEAGKAAAEAYRGMLEPLQAAVALEPGNGELHAMLARTYAYLGKRNEALRQVEAAEALRVEQKEVDLAHAAVFELLGERREAVRSLQAAVNHGLETDILMHDPEIQGPLAETHFK